MSITRREHDCSIYFAIRWYREGAAHEGQRFGCPVCGRVYRRAGIKWINVDAVGDIEDLIAHDARGRLVYEVD